MTYFNFERLINKYAAEFTVIPAAEGEYKGGVWETGKSEEYNAFGAVISLSQNKLYQLGGTMTSQDRYLYMTEALKSPLEGTKIKVDNNIYNVESNRDNGKEQFTGIYVYVLKWVSSFDKYKRN